MYKLDLMHFYHSKKNNEQSHFPLCSLSLSSPGSLDSSCQDVPCLTALCWCNSWEALGRFWDSTWTWMCPPWACYRRACSMWGTAWARSKIFWSNCSLWQSVILGCHLDKGWASWTLVWECWYSILWNNGTYLRIQQKLKEHVPLPWFHACAYDRSLEVKATFFFIKKCSSTPPLLFSDKNHAGRPPDQCWHQQG